MSRLLTQAELAEIALIERILASASILSSSDIGVTVAAQPTGTPNGSKFLRDDNSWATPSGGGGGSGNSYWPSGW